MDRSYKGTPTKRPVTQCPVTERPVTKRPVTERPGYKTSRIQNVQLPNVQLQNVQETKRRGHKTSSFSKFKNLFKKTLQMCHPYVVRSMGDAVHGCVRTLCWDRLGLVVVPNGQVDSCRGSCFLRSVQGVPMHLV